MAESKERPRGLVIVPAYQEASRIGPLVRRIRECAADLVVVDDGSTDGTAQEAEAAGAPVIRHGGNRGKGVALTTGFAYAREKGFDFVITMDGDGQHDPGDLGRFVEQYVREGTPVLVGNRMSDVASMPWIRRMTNRFMSWLLSREMGQSVPDTQCGYRLFRCDVTPESSARAAGFAAESEVLLRLSDRGVRIGSVPVATIYRDEKSKINPFKDTLRFFGMLRRYRREKRARGLQTAQ
jgi:glycosyltransferase involved in cell wall biosynthesis